MERSIKELTEHEFVKQARELVGCLQHCKDLVIDKATTEERTLRIYISSDFDRREVYSYIQGLIRGGITKIDLAQIALIQTT